MKEFAKDPDAKLDYVLDWSTWLAGDTIAQSEWIVPTGLSLVTHGFDATTATIWLAGGTAGELYAITNRITSAAGRIDDKVMLVRVISNEDPIPSPVSVGTNAYLSVADAAVYFGNRLHADAWLKATNADRAKAIISATAAVDRLSFVGTISRPDQRLAWPRANVRDQEGRPVPSDTIPDAVRRATCEWALALLSPAKTSAPVILHQVGDLKFEFAASIPDSVPPTVRAILAPFLRTGAADVELVF